ncbi:ThuA domain-containing protein [soil metagenome]
MARRFLTLALCITLTGTARTADPAVKLPPGVVLEENPKDSTANKVVIIAGSNYYKPGEHEYIAAAGVLMKLLAQTPGVAPVLALDWPKNPETLKNAKTVVFFFDGAEKHAALVSDHAKEVQALVDAKVGLTQMHQANDYPKDFGDRARSWSGAAWEKGMSQRAHWVTEFKEFPQHEITSGVTPFKIDDGYLWKLHFVDGMKGVTPLLRTENPKAKEKPKDANESNISWAFERPTGGRTFAFTGGHLHASLAEPGYRKFLVNGILWSAGLPIPKDGAKVDFDAKDLDSYLAPKPAPKAK